MNIISRILTNKKILGGIALFVFLIFAYRAYFGNGNLPGKAEEINWNVNSDWLLEIDSHGRKVTSEGNQDGILEYIFDNIGTTNKWFVEFGFNQPDYVHGGTGPNSQYLYEKKGFKGVLLDGDNENKEINLHKRWIKPETIVAELKKLGTPIGADYISVDFDSADCFAAYEIACKLNPRVMTVEFNANYPLGYYLANIGKDYRWKGDRAYGCSASAQDLVAKECNYSLVAVERDLDIFWIRNDLIPRVKMQPASYFAKHIPRLTHLSLSKFPERKLSEYICDFKVWLESGAKLGEYDACIKAAQPQMKKLIDAGVM